MVHIAIGCYRYQGQEILGVFDNAGAAQECVDKQADHFDTAYVIQRHVETYYQPDNE